jgi:hypothetical protein
MKLEDECPKSMLVPAENDEIEILGINKNR